MRKTVNYKHLIEDVAHFQEQEGSGYLPTMDAQDALNELCSYFLGDNWYEPTGQMHPKVVNYSIVMEIERQYKGCKIEKSKKSKSTKTKIIDIPKFIIGITNIILAILLTLLILFKTHDTYRFVIVLFCLLGGCISLMDSIETEKQRQRELKELQEKAELYGWNKRI